MKAFIYSVCMFLFLLFGVGQTTYGFSSETTSLQKHDTSNHTAVIERANDKAVTVEQLTLEEQEVSVSVELHQQQADRFSNFSGSGKHPYLFTLSAYSNYLERSLLINPSCARLVLIFPFHLFP
ncbi:hypothetical protein DSM03_103168 [Leeuwenhoekiella aestuarii]|uniref:Uncharacterized protein n=1 Tax=Leeuwenhoekiella aestuarii TaxID=2249426 RepID=A0A4Q0NWR5_9FLAO|nr:hypothetical protein [Leeuwenhoekiella aestuarii]RXG15983.1 hypothetical protein DSM03_103168 [Leeuwenhoekiella aestuarii]RXG16677.1 hypothetical protein DSM04_102258 [Leeuwenhoekiella aestuarii]